MTVSIMFGHKDGSFAPPITYATGGGPNAVAIGDFNGNGHPDPAELTAGYCSSCVVRTK